MKRLLVLLWPLVPCLLVSVLVHSTEEHLGGVMGVVSSPGVGLSVVVWALPLAACAYLALAGLVEGGVAGLLLVAVPTSGVLGFLLARAGSTATTTSGFLWSVTGAALILLVAQCLASLPPGLAIRRQRAKEDGAR